MPGDFLVPGNYLKNEAKLNSVQNDLADFNYFLLNRINRFIYKMINVISLVIYCLIFSTLHHSI